MLGVFSCRFTRRDCPHATLFHDSYQRVNRTRLNKILRCFPHCCHGHSQRSYCGASLHVQIDFDARSSSSSSSSSSSPSRLVPQPLVDDDVLVFARFRPALQSSHVVVGARLAPETVLSSLQSETNPTGEWIEGWLLASAHQSAWLFEVNRGARWHYGWGSSASTTARSTRHVLEVVVFVLRAVETGAAAALEVVATTLSPPFRVVSFRRRAQGTPASPPSDDATVVDTVPAMISTIDSHDGSLPSPRVSPPTVTLPAPDHDSDLSIVLAVACSATPLPVSHSRQWDRAFERAALARPHYDAPNPLSAGVAVVAADVAMWLAVDAVVQSDWRRALAHAAAHVASRPRLLNAHSDWLATLRARVDARLASTRPPWPSLAALARVAQPHVAGASAADAIVPLSFGAFVANVRQAAVAQNRALALTRRPLHNGAESASGGGASAISSWWYCPLERVAAWPLSTPSLIGAGASETPPVAVPLTAWFYRQLACIALIESHSQTVTIYSVPGVDTGVGAATGPQSPFLLSTTGMALELDGLPHWTATLPSGDATLGTRFAGDWVLGDYIAHPRRDAAGSLDTEWFAWQVQDMPNGGAVCTTARRVRLELSGVYNHNERLAVVTVDHGEFVDGSSHAPFDEAAPTARRLQRVRAWAPRWRLQVRYERVARPAGRR